MRFANHLLDQPWPADLPVRLDALASPLARLGVRNVECVASDFGSQARGKVLSRQRFVAEAGCRLPSVVFGTTVSGGEPPEVFARLIPKTYPDLRLVPDLATLVPQPFAEAQLSVVCEVHGRVASPLGGGELDLAGLGPRTLLKRALAQLDARGWRATVAPELEFFLFAPWPGQGPLRSAGSPTAATVHEPRAELYGAERSSLFAPYFDALWRACEAQRIPITGFAHESARSQYEVNFAPGEPLAQADAVWRFKRLARELALRLGFVASFMAQPALDDVGTGLHWHLSLAGADGNLMSGHDGRETPALRQAIAGLQVLAPAGLGLLAPHANSYARLHRQDAAPATADWGYDNRSVGLRVPDASPADRRIEVRLPGGDSNPYLALAWMLGAVHHGLTHGLQPSEPLAGVARTDGNPLALPCSLAAALDALDDLPQAIFDAVFKTAFRAIKCHELAERASCADPHTQWDLPLLLHNA